MTTTIAGPEGRDFSWLARLLQHAPAAVAWLEGPRHVFRFANQAYLDLIGPGSAPPCR